MRTSTRPSTSSAISASRTEGLETPSWRARSRSGGSRAPAVYSPLLISARIWSAIWRYSRRGSMLWKGIGAGRRPRRRKPDPRRRLPARGQVVKWYDQSLSSARAQDLGIAGFPLRPLIEHCAGVDDTQRELVERRLDGAIGRHETARKQQPLAVLADLEFIPQERSVGMCRPRGDADTIDLHNRRL